MSVVIRPIELKDKEAWTKLWCDPEQSYLEFYKGLDKVTKEATENTFSRFLDPNIASYAAVAEVNGELIGFVTYLTHIYTWSEQDKTYLGDLYVSPNSRLGGVGRKLIEYVYGEADKLNCPNVYWSTQFENHRAQLLYTKVGVKSGFLLYRRP
ncbi:D-amino-acid N-acetyltransferase [Yamadazyma tenuis]|uniref:N-acetyltransferase domain-containing protein n=1 Tax=Candida tenuis (strain ATCC 10573 / BCRC 21748 / CBS 615 / JCM 9827 / NBRC 10315 / NRRL Y-1498 / VKM Y-70) TaxID=590646 RepID=G3B4S6_CANTC|nr:uncharacterized protein CANTEDRAFT_104634 [Yamadazyma tenuis ATCC 10573]EGV63862.1 hypothetical protein CANTEDRAFT_104634 [Yamadazyma tenuis ATCC 10573]WEJ96526.1 D-amino-acid N-acetyltransferase [Yamadazyma tenuis]